MNLNSLFGKVCESQTHELQVLSFGPPQLCLEAPADYVRHALADVHVVLVEGRVHGVGEIIQHRRVVIA